MDKKNPGSEPGFESNGNLEQVFNTSNPPPQSIFPPGKIGEVAQFIYDASPRPVPIISLTAAEALIGGIAGRAFNIRGTGLNRDVLLVSPSGRGKEAMAAGISKLMNAVKKHVPDAMEFVGPTEIASPQGLIKWLARSPCIYSIVGEFGLKLKEMASPTAPISISGLKRTLLDLYNKSGRGDVLGAMAYSKREDNSLAIASPAFTLIGETTPSRFFENIDEGVISDGLLPRFDVIEYTGPRSKENKNSHAAIIPKSLLDWLCELCVQCRSVASTNSVNDIQIAADAEIIFDNFNEFCDGKINDSNELVCELFNRTHLKALKLAAVYAVGDNYISPCINAAQAKMACDKEYDLTLALLKHFQSGEIGPVDNNEALRRSALIKAVMQYLTNTFADLPQYGAVEELHREKIVPVSLMQRKLLDTAPFRNAKNGAGNAFKATLQAMHDADEIQFVPTVEMVKRFNSKAKSFKVSNAAAFIAPNENQSAPSACGHSKGVFFK